MWYEILPGFGIICGCVVASGLAIKTIDKLFHGKVGIGISYCMAKQLYEVVLLGC